MAAWLQSLPQLFDPRDDLSWIDDAGRYAAASDKR